MGRNGEVVVEERLELRGEVAQLVVRFVDGALSFYPVVASVQRDGMCVEVRFPSGLDDALVREAELLTTSIANLVEGVGVMAVEYFVTDDGLVVNEVALRPHNTGHWTIEGTSTSQFAQHLRAVSGQAPGEVELTSPFAVMVNVVGAATPGSIEDALAVEGVFVHEYGKTWRPGRKLGHVTALGDEPLGPHVRAWSGARAYGTATQEA
jgi:5-(carboxyamino)imidazole ribonucleotide synthase